MRLKAAEAKGAVHGVSEYVIALNNRRSELRRHRQMLGDPNNGHVTARALEMDTTIEYLTAEIERASAHQDALNSLAIAAESAADRLAEHLESELVALGLVKRRSRGIDQ